MRMRFSFILCALATVLLLAGGVGSLVYRNVTARIERTLVEETRAVLMAHIAGENLEGLEVRFDGLEGEVTGIVADPERRRRLGAAIDLIDSGNVPALEGRVMGLENRLVGAGSSEEPDT